MLRFWIDTGKRWMDDDPFTHSAAIAYYTIFSLPALLIILMGIGSVFLENGRMEDEIVRYLEGSLGTEAAENIHQAMVNSLGTYDSGWAFLVGAVLLLMTSLRLFMQLQKALNVIWKTEAESDGAILKLIRQRLISFSVMVSFGFVLLVSLVVTTTLTALGEWLARYVPDYLLMVFHLVNWGLSLATITLIFTIIFKLLPDRFVPWKAAAAGGLASACLFVLGEYGLGIYFNIAEPQSAYGLAGSLILLMLWVSYSCVILFFGAQVSRSYALFRQAKQEERLKGRGGVYA